MTTQNGSVFLSSSGPAQSSIDPAELSFRRASAVSRGFWAILLFFLAGSAFAAKPGPFAEGERVLFLGDSITRAGGWYGVVSLFHATRYPERRIQWLNAGISGDTAAGALKRLDWDVLARRPDWVIVMFGVNDVGVSLYDGRTGAEIERQRAEKLRIYDESMRRLVARLKAERIRVVLCTPPPYDETMTHASEPRRGANAAVSRCAEITREIAAEQGLPLIEFNGFMNTLMAERREIDPRFTLMADRVHPNGTGYFVMGYRFLEALDVEGTVAEMVTNKLDFTWEGRRFPFPVEARQAEAMTCVPFAEKFNRLTLRVTDLAPGRYEVRMGGTVAGTWRHDELARGVDLGGLSGIPIGQAASAVGKVHDRMHHAASWGPRMIAYTRHFTLPTLRVDERDDAAVRKALEAFLSADTGRRDYARTMAEKYLEFKPKEAEIAANLVAAEEELHRLAGPWSYRMTLRKVPAQTTAAPLPVPITELPLPHDVTERRRSFNDRNSPDQIGRLAVDLFALLDPTHPGVARAYALHAQGRDGEALAEFRVHFFRKLRTFAGLISPLVYKSRASADELMQGVVTTAAGAKYQMGEPGTIPWEYPIPMRSARPGVGKDDRTDHTLWHTRVFDPLLVAFAETGERPFLERWEELMDDACLNNHVFKGILPEDIADEDSGGARHVVDWLERLRQVGARLPEDGSGFSETTLARMLVRLLPHYPAVTIVYARSNPQNWNYHSAHALILAGLLLDEFRVASVMLREGRRLFESLPTTHGLPDGSGAEQDPVYNHYYVDQALHTLRAIERLRPDLLTPERRDEWMDFVRRRFAFVLHQLRADGRLPSMMRIDPRKWTETLERTYAEVAPELISDPINAALLAAPADAPGASPPPFTSEWFTYGGYRAMRDHWGPKAQHGFFFSSHHPGNYEYHSQSGKNSFTLWAYGQDLLLAEEVGHYDIVKSPLRVDGLEQNHHADITFWGHRHALTSAWDEPDPERWYSDSSFDLTEGTYAGPYGKTGEIRDVKHARRVIFIKEAGLWIVADRVESPGRRRYAQDWRLPLQPVAPRWSKVTQAFAPESVRIDDMEGCVHAGQTGMPGVSIYQSGSVAVRISKERESVNPTDLYRVTDFLRIQSEFSGSGPQVLSSLIVPNEAGDSSQWAVQRLSKGESAVSGFVVSGGRAMRVQYATRAQGAGEIVLDRVSAKAEMLLLMNSERGVVKGMAIDCEWLAVEGTAQALTKRDFVFRIENGRVNIIGAVQMPIPAPTISPRPDVFVDSAKVRLESGEPDVDLRYTTDLSEPGVDSPLYTEPLEFHRTTVLKARAFRRGETPVAGLASGTARSVVARAVFTRNELRSPDKPGHAATSGLRYRHYVGLWSDLFMRLDTLTEVSKGAGVRLFDLSPVRREGPFSMRYEGYIEIPQDGVYTFYAPKEWLRPESLCGYDLQVYIGPQAWDPITRRQGFGTWSVALRRGLHAFAVVFCDFRGPDFQRHNDPGKPPRVGTDRVPRLELSGPGLERQAIPDSWLSH